MMMTSTNNMISSMALALVASAAVLGFAAGPAQANEVRVDVASYQLSTAEGRRAIEARVSAAADSVCARGGLDHRQLAELASYNRCVAGAKADARSQLQTISARGRMAAS